MEVIAVLIAASPLLVCMGWLTITAIRVPNGQSHQQSAGTSALEVEDELTRRLVAHEIDGATYREQLETLVRECPTGECD